MNIYDTLHAAVQAVAARLGTDVRVAYIGNSPGRPGGTDNRAWYVSVEGIRGGFHYNNTLTTGQYRTENLASLLAFVEDGGIEETIGKAKGRWDADGQFHSGYRFSPVKDWRLEVTETPEQVEAALAGIPAIEFVPRPRRVRA
jgi:hypothetical protein|tara:strand:- start:56 stop:484 length:429 start_codon:yes stop_codon:yes gene_type:complete